MTQDNTLLRVENLVKHFPISRGIVFQRQVGAVHAVDGISFSIQKGETFGLVGESGCGKTTAGRTILQLYRPTSGHVYFGDLDLAKARGEELRHMRRRMQMIFQDPYASLNPRMTVGEIIEEPLVVPGQGIFVGSDLGIAAEANGSHEEANDRSVFFFQIRLAPAAGLEAIAEGMRTQACATDVSAPAVGRGLIRASPRRCYICHEIGSGPYYAYLWGEELRAYFELPQAGHTLATNLHADTYEEARHQICAENGVPEAALTHGPCDGADACPQQVTRITGDGR
jgi:ABC-type dipeptide/oligopeptide/nickel transport system ATPase subunit